MRCVHCGMANPERVIFCRKCGERLAGTRRKPESSSSSSSVSPAVVPFSMRVSQQDTTPLAITPRTRRPRRWVLWALTLMVSAFLVAAAVLVFQGAPSPQSISSVSQTLSTYCDAIRRGDYQRAYNEMANSFHQHTTEADFAYEYQHKTKVTSCEVSNVSVGSSSATGTVNVFFADGSVETDMMELILENGVWKIQGEITG